MTTQAALPSDCLFSAADLSALNSLSRRMCERGIWSEGVHFTPTEGPGADTFMIYPSGHQTPAYSIEKHPGGNYVLQDGEGNVIRDRAASLHALLNGGFPPA